MPDFTPRIRDLITLLDDAVQRYPQRTLFGERRAGEWRYTTYAEFSRKVDAIRAGLSGLGIRKGDRVAIVSGNSVTWAAGAYATYGLGAIWVPMYEAQQDRERRHILADCGARVCFAANEAIARNVLELRRTLPALEHVVCIDGQPSGAIALPTLLSQSAVTTTIPSPDDIAAIVYTSGTTGDPKGVVLSHANLATNVAAGLHVFHLVPDDRSLAFLPWAHLYGQTVELHTIIGAGASTALCDSIPRLMDDLVEVRPTLLVAVPAIFNRIYAGVRRKMAESPAPVRALFEGAQRVQAKERHGEHPSAMERAELALAKRLVYSRIVARFGGRLKFAVSAGAALSREVAEFIDGLGVMVCEAYGLTETSPGATLNTPTDRRLGSCGKPIPGVTVTLDESRGSEAGEGEIVVRGHNVMQGYHHMPEETARVTTADGGFRTGDLGRIDRDGYVYVTGRVKELYKLDNGKYVAPVPVEEKIALSLFVRQVMVYGENRPFNVAIVVPEEAMLRAGGIDPDDLPRVREVLRREIAQRSEGLKPFERVRDLVLAREEFTVANDLLTPKLSLKRRNIVRRYKAELEEIYGQPARASRGPDQTESRNLTSSELSRSGETRHS